MKRFRVAQIEGTRSFFRQPPQFHYIRSSTPYCHPKMHSATRHLLYEIQSFHLNNLSSAAGASLAGKTEENLHHHHHHLYSTTVPYNNNKEKLFYLKVVV